MANNNSYIFNETAGGTINGVNTIFTTVNPIETIESLRIGYVEYTNFTYSGNTITLHDAPTVISGGVFVDYFYGATDNVFDSVNLIYDEVLIGNVDGVNKLFYSIYPIDKIDELRINGVIYTNFTFNGRAVTLNDAPTAVVGAPHLDYYRKDVNMPIIDSLVTFSSLRSSIYLRIGHTVTSLQFPKDLADEYIKEGVVRISKMKRDRKKRGVFSFHKAGDGVISSVTGSSINVGTTSKYLPSKGVAIIDGGDVVYYNQKTTTSITSITDMGLDDVADYQIQYGYKLSKNIEKISEVFVNGFKLNPADFAEYRYRKNPNDFCEYNGYLFLPYNTNDGDIVTVVYNAKYTTTYTDTDIIDFDGDYLPVIKTFVLWNMYHDREDDRAIAEKNRYQEVLREYKRELSKQYENTSSVMQTGGPLNRW